MYLAITNSGNVYALLTKITANDKRSCFTQRSYSLWGITHVSLSQKPPA